MTRSVFFVVMSALLLGCSGGTDDDGDVQGGTAPDSADVHAGHVMPGASQDTSAAGGEQASMPGMDHSGMDMSTSAPAADAHAGMANMQRGDVAADPHAGMPGMQDEPTAAAGSADPHAGMPGMRPQPAEAADPHAGMPGMRPPTEPAAANAHAAMPGMPADAETDVSPATAALHALAAALLEDSVVRARIAGDTALQRRWQDPAVRRLLTRDSVR